VTFTQQLACVAKVLKNAVRIFHERKDLRSGKEPEDAAQSPANRACGCYFSVRFAPAKTPST
jgi:hypothetical protein